MRWIAAVAVGVLGVIVAPRPAPACLKPPPTEDVPAKGAQDVPTNLAAVMLDWGQTERLGLRAADGTTIGLEPWTHQRSIVSESLAPGTRYEVIQFGTRRGAVVVHDRLGPSARSAAAARRRRRASVRSPARDLAESFASLKLLRFGAQTIEVWAISLAGIEGPTSQHEVVVRDCRQPDSCSEGGCSAGPGADGLVGGLLAWLGYLNRRARARRQRLPSSGAAASGSSATPG
jgi:hypothetical protein